MTPGVNTRCGSMHLSDAEYAELQRLVQYYQLAARVIRLAIAKLAREIPSPGRAWEMDATNEGPST